LEPRTELRRLLERLCAPARDPRGAPRTVIVVAHPDDEVIGAGGRLPRLREVALVHVTDGSPRDLGDARSNGFSTREEYAEARRREMAAALALAGIDEAQTYELGCVDQEASLHLEELSWGLAGLLRELRPEVMLTHPYEGGHPDHDATAFVARAACRLLAARGERVPALLEMTSYHNGPTGIQVGDFLPAGDSEAATVTLSGEERALKQQMLDCYRSQQNTVRLFPVEQERFRLAPCYDFTRPPHEGLLFYECFPWGMTGARFCELAGAAAEALGLA
jgi:N-acetylglucosamine malate deacetylase 2